MSVRKDEKRGTWLVKLHYTNHDGETIDSTKRGFKTKTEALAWERWIGYTMLDSFMRDAGSPEGKESAWQTRTIRGASPTTSSAR